MIGVAITTGDEEAIDKQPVTVSNVKSTTEVPTENTLYE